MRPLDLLAVAAYAALTLGIALAFARRNTSTEEYFRRARRSDAEELRAARVIAGASATLMVLGALLFAHLPKERMNDVSLTVTSVFGGCLMGLFVVGFFTRRVDGASANRALAAAVALNVYLGLGALGALPAGLALPVHSYWVGVLVNGTFALVAWLASLYRGTPAAELPGLTVWSLPGRRAAPGREVGD